MAPSASSAPVPGNEPMPTLPKELRDTVMRLPAQLRAQLAEQLIASLEQEPADADAELLWVAEAERRAEEFSTGVAKGVPAGDAIAKARAKLR